MSIGMSLGNLLEMPLGAHRLVPDHAAHGYRDQVTGLDNPVVAVPLFMQTSIEKT